MICPHTGGQSVDCKVQPNQEEMDEHTHTYGVDGTREIESEEGCAGFKGETHRETQRIMP